MSPREMALESVSHAGPTKVVEEREVAYRLLIELLAHQFAFPVRWIETQNTFFSREIPITRFIEIGPSKVLTRMAKGTGGTGRFRVRDKALIINRMFLATSTDSREIEYEYDHSSETEQDAGETDAKVGAQSANGMGNNETVPKQVVTSPLLQQVAAAGIADIPISALQIVQALVAQKLRTPFEQVRSTKSIKMLSGGKSTLQNELLGDLGNEFGNLPDASEDLSLTRLAELLELNFSGQLGKQSSKLISKMISAKMPAGFNHSVIRDYLEHTWGLGPSRQAAVFLLAMIEEPRARLTSVKSAKSYIDSQVSRYAASSGLVLQAVHENLTSSGPTAMVDSGQIKALRKEQNKLHLKQLGVLADHLKMDPFEDSKTIELKLGLKESHARLDLWHSEFSADFETGITPSFNLLKVRQYDSWWNLVRQDIIELYHKMENGEMNNCRGKRAAVYHQIANRVTRDVQLLLQQLISAVSERDTKDGFLSTGRELLSAIKKSIGSRPVFKFASPAMRPRTTITKSGSVKYDEILRFNEDPTLSYLHLVGRGSAVESGDAIPQIHIRSKSVANWKWNKPMTEIFLECISVGIDTGISFAGKDVLVTGAGPGSIGAEVVKGLLMGGARVIVTTSRTVSETASFYQGLYEQNGSRGAELLVVPFNQGSVQDCESLVDYIYRASGLGRSLDAILPFAAVSEAGKEIDAIGAKSELAHRLMLVNFLRLLGCIVKCKREQNIFGRPTQVVLPLSPNHGTFGGDGLYSESKLGLAGLLNRFHSENWSDFISIAGAMIGWTRGTGLMSENDSLAETVESHGVITFSQREMAFNILALMSAPMVELCEAEPIWADLSGGLHLLPDLKKTLVDARSRIGLEAEIRRAIKTEDERQRSFTTVINLEDTSGITKQHHKPRSTLKIGFPTLPGFERDVQPLQDLEGMVDPASTIVIVGISEIGPWGSARTRWEMEAFGEFTQEGYVEMAWMMNKIRYFEGDYKGGHYVGWVDALTGEPVHDSEIPEKYRQSILEHSGVRIIEPELFGGYDPSRKEFLHEVAIEEDLPEFDATLASSEAFRLRHGNKVSIRRVGTEDEYKVKIKSGAHIMVPKATPLDSIVAGQIPTGWDAQKYGIPEDLIAQVDPVTLFVLCCACECLYSAGIVNSLEIFKHIHVSELGNFIGTAMGGTTKTRQLYKDRYLDKAVQGDVIQETYHNTSAAWMNMLLLGAAGPIKTPTGTCATGLESLDSACESILAGKTKMCFIGGVDDFQEDEAYGFATMKATVNTKDEFAKGRMPREMSRPMTHSRAGFVESQGCGMQLIATAELALEMGLPIYGIVASSTMAADRIGRSVPAPGQGVLTFARESAGTPLLPLLDIKYRRVQLESSMDDIRSRRYDAVQQTYLGRITHAKDPDQSNPAQPETAKGKVIANINHRADPQTRQAQKLWGNDLRRLDTGISPLRASLAVWGLGINDIEVVSMHGTSTQANDKNEAEVINKQMRKLGRTPGRPLLAICQKSLTGHPKAPAASWMLNGCLQSLESSIVPGNRNADNIDKDLLKSEHIVFPTKSIKTRGIKAFMLDSFGFGQKGGQMIGVAPQYFFATLTRAAFDEYATRVSARKITANRAYMEAIMSKSLFKARTTPPYFAVDESSIYMDPLARISDSSRGELFFHNTIQTPTRTVDAIDSIIMSREEVSSSAAELAQAAGVSKQWLEMATRESNLESGGKSVTIGIDVEEVASFNSINQIFLDRNFSVAEQELSCQSPNPRSAFAGRWCAKEAVFKSLGVASKGAGAQLKDIEILSDGGIPKVVLHGDALIAAQTQSIESFNVSLSHSDNNAIAVALAIRRTSDR